MKTFFKEVLLPLLFALCLAAFFKPIYMADWIVGINGTRLFSTLYHKKLVVGRVQTPTLAMLVERDGKITTCRKKKYFNVHTQKNGLKASFRKDQN